MVDNIVRQLFWLVWIVTMVFNGPIQAHTGPSQAEVKGIVGTDITLQFTFNNSIKEDLHFAVYKANKKIAEFRHSKSFGKGIFDVYPKNTTVFYHITNLQLNDSECYRATLFTASGLAIESNRVQLNVQTRVENKSSTVPVPPMQSYTPTPTDSGSPSHFVTVLVVSPVMLLAAVLPCLIWCLVRSKDKERPPQQNSNPTVQETVESSNNAPAVIYSVLDFPKRPPVVLEINPSDTEYAAVSYLPQNRPV